MIPLRTVRIFGVVSMIHLIYHSLRTSRRHATTKRPQPLPDPLDQAVLPPRPPWLLFLLPTLILFWRLLPLPLPLFLIRFSRPCPFSRRFLPLFLLWPLLPLMLMLLLLLLSWRLLSF